MHGCRFQNYTEQKGATHEANSIDRQYLDEFDTKYFEVIGNIFDNPELLQEEADE